MNSAAKYVWAAIAVAVAAHLALIHAAPRVLMGAAIERVGAGGYNQWRLSERVTEASRTIVRPSPDFAYSVCAYDLGDGPVAIRVEPWDAYWSLSLYAANSDNYFVIDDREVRDGADVTLVRRGRAREVADDTATRVVESPSRRGIALIRRLAPSPAAYDAAAAVARADLCARLGG